MSNVSSQDEPNDAVADAREHIADAMKLLELATKALRSAQASIEASTSAELPDTQAAQNPGRTVEDAWADRKDDYEDITIP